MHRSGGHGGITIWLLNISNEFQQHGHDVELLISAPNDRKTDHPRLDRRIKVINLGNKKPSLYKNLLHYLRNQQPHIILTAGYRYHSAIALTLPLAKVTTKWVLTIHENASQAVATIGLNKRLGRTLALRLAIKSADKTIGVSADLVNDLIQNWGLTPDKASFIHNAVVDKRVVDLGQEEVSHPFFKSGDKVLLSIGRLERQKDYPTLFKAFAELAKSENVRLIVLGEGSLKKKLQDMLDDMKLAFHIDLAGFTSNPFSYMRQADGVVMSSRWEGFGNVLAEALAQGTPIVSTDCPSGPAEILDHGKYGPLVPVGDVKALAEGMRQVLHHPLPKETLKTRAQAFSVKDRAADYLKLFQQLV